MNKIIGNNLRFIRKLKKMSLMQLAEKMNIKYQQVGKYELGQNQLCAFRLYRLLIFLDVRLSISLMIPTLKGCTAIIARKLRVIQLCLVNCWI